ncbi:hypothetical protein Tco_0464750 [Tanacetum coccineum]
MPRECLKIIESKSKVRQSRSKAIVSKVSTSSSTPAVSSDVAELKDMVRALILDKKNQTPAPASVKAVEQSCVTCGGGHSYQNCPATNDYRDNIQEYVSQAAAVNYNQGNASYRPQMINQPPSTFQAHPYHAPVLEATGYDATKHRKHLTSGGPNSFFQATHIANPNGDVKANQLPEAVFPIMDLKLLIFLKRRNEPDAVPRLNQTLTYLQGQKEKFREKRRSFRLIKFMEIFLNLHFELCFADAL